MVSCAVCYIQNSGDDVRIHMACRQDGGLVSLSAIHTEGFAGRKQFAPCIMAEMTSFAKFTHLQI